jgi:hypothetical protein
MFLAVTLKELQPTLPVAKGDATHSELRLRELRRGIPGFQSQPWAEIGERFQRKISRVDTGSSARGSVTNVDVVYFP